MGSDHPPEQGSAGTPANRDTLEKLRLEIEQRRLSLDEERLRRGQRFLNKNFATILTAMISIGAVTVSGLQVWVAFVNQDAESARLSREQEMEWKTRVGKFLVEQQELLFSEKTEKRELARYALELQLPSEQAWQAYHRLTKIVPDKYRTEYIEAQDRFVTKTVVPSVDLWRNAPTARRHPAYMTMSRRLQRELRRGILSNYLKTKSSYRNLGLVGPLLVYASLPISTSVTLQANGLILNTDRKVYWDYLRSDIRRGMIRSAQTQANLRSLLAQAREVIDDKKLAGFYAPDKVRRWLSTSLSGDGEIMIRILLREESKAVDVAVQTGRELARKSKGRNLSAEQYEAAVDKMKQRIIESYQGKATLYGKLSPDDWNRIWDVAFTEAPKAFASMADESGDW